MSRQRRAFLWLPLLAGLLIAVLLPAPLGTPRFSSAAAPSSIVTRVELDPVVVRPGGSFNGDVRVWVKNVGGTRGLGAYDLAISFDKTKIRVNGISGGAAPFQNLAAHNAVAGANGANSLGQLLFNAFHTSIPGPSGNVHVATVNVSALASGNHTLTPGVTTLADVQGDNIAADAIIGFVYAYDPPVASFSASPTSGTTPLTVSFTDLSTGPPTAWAWDLDGNGTADSSTRNPSVTYNTAGNYNVGLTVTNPAGSSSTSQTVSIYTTPVAAFTASATSANPGSPIIFTDQSTGNIVSWSWNFGDGTGSSSQNPTKSYGAAGTYSVVLTVTNPVGSNTLTGTGYIQIVNYAAETAIIQGVTAGNYAYVGGYINRFFNYADGSPVILADGIGAYDAYMSYSAAGVSIKAAAGVARFSSPSFTLNTLGGTASTISASQVGSAPQPPLELFRFFPSLIGSKDLACTITLRFNTITRVAGGQVPQNTDVSKTFRRGDANNSGAVNITDALLIAQHLAGLRPLGEGSGEVWAVNAATPRNDSPTAGDSITITDALFIAQMLAGLRDASYNLV